MCQILRETEVDQIKKNAENVLYIIHKRNKCQWNWSLRSVNEKNRNKEWAPLCKSLVRRKTVENDKQVPNEGTGWGFLRTKKDDDPYLRKKCFRNL